MSNKYQNNSQEKIVSSSNVEESKVLLKEIRLYEWRSNVIARLFRSIRFTIVKIVSIVFIDMPRLILIEFILKLFEILVSSKNLTWAIAIISIFTQLFKSVENSEVSQDKILLLIQEIISKGVL